MAEQTASSASTPPVPTDAIQITETPRSSDRLSDRVSADEYMERYAHDFYEWVDGELIKMSPVREEHDLLSAYFRRLLDTYFELRPIGTVRADPFVMRVDSTNSRREPDLQIILNTNPGELTKTMMIGPADIVIEIVSPESVERDYGTKLSEYERGGIPEYWMFDPIHTDAFFRRLNEQGIYELIAPDADGYYTTPLLPGLKIHVPTLWNHPLPGNLTIVDSLRAMLSDQ
jgi:Uma2 family endonuclease